jgi:beta-lactamase regulating signal transducer with metallopeptidase domain
MLELPFMLPMTAPAAILLLLKAAAVLSIAWLICRGASRASAAVRHGIWALALCLIVLLPIAEDWLPTVPVELPAPLRVSSLESTAAPVVGTVAEATSREFGGFAPSPPDAPTAEAGLITSRAPGSASRPVDWARTLLLGWLVGVVLRLGWLSALLVRTRQLARRAARYAGRRHLDLVAGLAAEVGVTRRVRVLHSPFFSMPLAWGVFRPVIILPSGADDWSAERLRVVLLHELAHIRRWDYLTSLVSELACALYWPLPLVWVARRRLRSEQEQACDDSVLATGASPLDYADHLLAIARAFYGSRLDLGLALTMAREISLKHRIRAILDAELDRRPLRSRRGMGTAAAMIAIVLPVAALSGAEPAGDASVPVESDRSPAPTEAAPARLAPAVAASPASLWLEAEAGSTSGNVWTNEDLDASAAAYLVLAGNPRQGQSSGRAATASYRFVLDSPGEYVVWARLRRAGENSAILATSINGEAPELWDLDIHPGAMAGGWTWVPIVGGNSDTGSDPVPLTDGEHTLQVSTTTGQIRLDRILLTSDITFIPKDRGAAEPGFRASYQLLEAEAADSDGRVRSPRDDRASAGEFLTFLSSRRRDPAGSVTFTFDVADAGRYLIWGRVLSPDDDSNSLYASINGGPTLIWDAPDRDLRRDQRAWEWDPISARDANGRTVDPVVFDLEPGRNVLTLRTREAGIRLDAILVTNDLVHQPRGLWPERMPAEPANIWIEAESARLQPPLLLQPRLDASGGQLVAVSDIGGEPSAPGEAGIARFRFSVEKPGIYSLWGRTIAGTSDEDSFWVRLDRGDWIRWNDIPKGDSWAWSAVHDTDNAGQIVQFRLDTGEHTLELAGREGGVMLDRLLLTNDPLVEPGTLP